MPTTMHPPIRAGKSYKVAFASDLASTGAVLLVVGWVPRHQQPVPAPEMLSIAPGQRVEVTGIVPSSASVRRLMIVVDLDAGELGKLVVLEDEVPHVFEDISSTVIWGMAVQ